METLPESLTDRAFRVCKPGDEKAYPELAELLVAYAQALWEWTKVESFLFLAFAHAIAPNSNEHSDRIRVAFFSVVSPQARLDMVNAIITSAGNADHIRYWAPLYKEFRAELTTRGKIAHLIGHSYKAHGRKKARAVLMEPIWHPKTKHTHAEANSVIYTADYLKSLAEKWGLLEQRLSVFVMMMHVENKPPEYRIPTAHLRALLDGPNTPSGPESPGPSPPSRPKGRKAALKRS